MAAAGTSIVSPKRRFFEMHKSDPVTWVAIGGHQDQVEELAGHLHPYLQKRMLGTFVIDPAKRRRPTRSARVATLEASAASRQRPGGGRPAPCPLLVRGKPWPGVSTRSW